MAFLVAMMLFIISNTIFASSAPEITSTIGNEVVFELTGAPGDFQKTIGYYSFKTQGRVTIQFSVSDLVYLGPYKEQTRLDDVVYWINNQPQMNFRPGKPLILKRGNGFHEFTLHGRVTIKAIEDQPAGDYGGTIYITVSPSQ